MPAARALLVLLLSLVVAVLVVACANSSASSPPSATPESVAPATPVAGSHAPAPESPTEEPATSEAPVSEAPPPTAEPEPSPDDEDEPLAGECTGTDENLEFFEEFAEIVDWPVYCPALPSGWFVGTGQWRQAGGPRLEISYRGPGGAGLLLQQGAYCPAEAGCVPPGEDVGETAFGDRDGTLIRTADGWAVVVDEGGTPSWLLTMTGVSEDAARRIASDRVEVGG